MLDTLICLATAVYFESRGEPVKGQYAVAEVVVNRALDDQFPDSVCEVVHEERRPGKCQFSFVCSRDLTVRDPESFSNAIRVAAHVLYGDTSYAGGALFFHTTSIRPSWTRDMEVTTKVGNHIFLK